MSKPIINEQIPSYNIERWKQLAGIKILKENEIKAADQSFTFRVENVRPDDIQFSGEINVAEREWGDYEEHEWDDKPEIKMVGDIEYGLFYDGNYSEYSYETVIIEDLFDHNDPFIKNQDDVLAFIEKQVMQRIAGGFQKPIDWNDPEVKLIHDRLKKALRDGTIKIAGDWWDGWDQ